MPTEISLTLLITTKGELVKKAFVFGFIATFLMMGCGDDKKTVIPTKLDNPIPTVAAPAGGAAPAKGKGPGGSTKAE